MLNNIHNYAQYYFKYASDFEPSRMLFRVLLNFYKVIVLLEYFDFSTYVMQKIYSHAVKIYVVCQMFTGSYYAKNYAGIIDLCL